MKTSISRSNQHLRHIGLLAVVLLASCTDEASPQEDESAFFIDETDDSRVLDEAGRDSTADFQVGYDVSDVNVSELNGMDPNTVTPLDAVPSITAAWEPVPGGHFCMSTGFNAQGEQGVVCNNFYQVIEAGSLFVTAEIELKCGNSAGLLPCTSAMAEGHLATGQKYTARCVPSGPACPRPPAVYKVRSGYDFVVGACTTVTATADATSGHGGFTLPHGQKVTPHVLTSSIRLCPPTPPR